jgi:hypothetical protein
MPTMHQVLGDLGGWRRQIERLPAAEQDCLHLLLPSHPRHRRQSLVTSGVDHRV